jgi:transposase
MLLSALFSLSADLCLVDVRLEDEGVTLVLRSSQTTATCPECAQPSTRVYGHYTRRLADLPCQKRPVRVCLEVRRFRCATRGCPRATFGECFPTLTAAYARRTLRLAESLTEIAFAQGGKAGAKLAKRLGIPTSRDTLLRLIRGSQIPKRKTPQVLGLDDFAWKKGDRYGTLLVDLQAHCPVEVLPDREADTVVRWLRAHRGVKIISRDRAGTYAEAAKRGAPRAKQVADRYHILVNLRDALKGTLARKPESLSEVEAESGEPRSSSQPSIGSSQPSHLPDARRQEDEPAGTPQDHGASAPAARTLTVAEQRRQISRANRLVRYEQIVALHQGGLSQRMIARHLHVSRKVVRRSLKAGVFPERAPTGKRQSKLDPYLPYLRKRWEEGCHNGLQLARELQVQGFRGSASLVRRLIGDWRARLPGPPERVRGKKRQAAPPARRRLSPRHASWLFVKDQQQLTADQRTFIQRICQANTALQELYQLGQDFVQMVKQRQARQLDPWLARAHQSSSVELRGFAAGIKRDYAAVQAALSLPWSQGQVEGQITRLKLLKRQMYGRARFDLLRLRVLSTA